MFTFARIALRNLLQARRRTALLCTALGIVSMLLVLLMSLSQGLTDTMVHSATTLSSGHINIGGFYKAKPEDAYPMITRVDEIRQVVRQTLGDEVTLLIDRNRGWGKIISETGSMQVGMNGVDIAEERALVSTVQMAKESSFLEGGRDLPAGSFAALAEPNSVVLFASQAKRLSVNVGDRVTLNTEAINGAVNTLDVQVVGVAEDVGFMSSWSIFVPKQVLRDIYQLNDNTSGAVMVYLEDISRANAAMGELRAALADVGFAIMDHQPEPFWMKFEVVGGEDWTGQKLDLTLWEDEVSFMKLMLGAFETLGFFLISILMVIIIVGIMNTMWIAVRERTSEIGTMRAIGMAKGQVLRLFVLEATILGFFATGLGGSVGALVAFALDAAQITIDVEAVKVLLMSDTLQLSVRPGQIVRAVITFTLFTVLAALWPAVRAARLQPVTAIHRAA